MYFCFIPFWLDRYWYEFGNLYPQMTTVWIPLDRATRQNSCLQVSGHHVVYLTMCHGVQRITFKWSIFFSRFHIYRGVVGKACLWGKARLSNRDKLEYRNFSRSKSRYDTFQKTNNKSADQTARMRRLVCVFVIAKPRRRSFSRRGPY